MNAQVSYSSVGNLSHGKPSRFIRINHLGVSRKALKTSGHFGFWDTHDQLIWSFGCSRINIINCMNNNLLMASCKSMFPARIYADNFSGLSGLARRLFEDRFFQGVSSFPSAIFAWPDRLVAMVRCLASGCFKLRVTCSDLSVTSQRLQLALTRSSKMMQFVVWLINEMKNEKYNPSQNV